MPVKRAWRWEGGHVPDGHCEAVLSAEQGGISLTGREKLEFWLSKWIILNTMKFSVKAIIHISLNDVACPEVNRVIE